MTGLRRLGVALAGESAAAIRFPSGSRVLSLPGTPASVRGWTAALLVLDEAAFIDAETWTAALGLVATGGRLVVQSTLAAAEGAFYGVVTQEDSGWTRFAVRSDEVPTVSAAFLADMRQRMTPAAFRAEFEAEFLPPIASGPRLWSPATIAAVFEEVPSP